ncbi:MAG: class I SAM-dependent methyltransferase [Chitinophagales bacterium]|jgi:ubiquinone/menaquinone biosynthesis C-methylase UbiE|nr:class I SAM-dependent methyltransferase [Chitinophagales bacterium]
MKYNVQEYWEEVAQRIKDRNHENYLAGDDEPYYEYKRKLSLSILSNFKVSQAKVFELGFGASGNLFTLLQGNPLLLYGADLSPTMFSIAQSRMKDYPQVSLSLLSSHVLPYEDKYFDISFTITVLQHNTDENALRNTVEQLCRVTKKNIVIAERIESSIKGDNLCMGRPVSFYESLFNSYGFSLEKVEFLPLSVSYYVCGAIRKIANPSHRKEGEPSTKLAIMLQKLVLPVTKLLDKVFPNTRDMAYLTFVRTE